MESAEVLGCVAVDRVQKQADCILSRIIKSCAIVFTAFGSEAQIVNTVMSL